MKKTAQLLTALICFALWQASVQAATNYWDSNGITAGAGAAPTGTWDADTFWSTDSEGTNATAAWASGNMAVFSAGTDATDLFTVTINGDVQPAGITFEEGVPTISGGTITMNAADFPIIANTNATIASGLESFGTGFMKTGTGTLTLSGGGFHDGTDTIAEGVVAIKSATALGSTLAPTIVSNGATAMFSLGTSEPLNLNGQGFSGGGAMRGAANFNYNGRVTLDSASRINSDTNQLSLFTFTGDRNFDLTVGGAGNVRLNVNGGFLIGTGKLIKDGPGWVQTEGVTYTCSAVEFNDGIFRFRELPGGGFRNAALTSYVDFTIGPDADEFRTVLTSTITVGNPILLNATNLLMTLVSNSQITLSGVVSGSSGGLAKGTNVASVLNLNNANTYGGNTTVQGGTLTLGAGGSIASSPVIDVWSGATFDVSLVSGGFVLGASQTLKGNGAVAGNVTANGTISPGASIGSLTFSNNLTVSKLLIEVDKSVSPSNDVMVVVGTLTAGTGTLTVNNLGPTLAVGDAFYLFKDALGNNKAVASGGSLTVTGGGATWNNNLAVNGSISVASVSTPSVIQHPQITSIAGAGTTSVTVNYTNTLPGTNYVLQYRTNLNATNWTSLSPVPAGGTTSSATDTPPASSLHRYYRVYYVAQ